MVAAQAGVTSIYLSGLLLPSPCLINNLMPSYQFFIGNSLFSADVWFLSPDRTLIVTGSEELKFSGG